MTWNQFLYWIKIYTSYIDQSRQPILSSPSQPLHSCQLNCFLSSLHLLFEREHQNNSIFLEFIYLFFEKGEGRERNINVWEKHQSFGFTHHQWGTWPAIQACALTWNWTGDLLVRRPWFSPLSHTRQGDNSIFFPSKLPWLLIEHWMTEWIYSVLYFSHCQTPRLIYTFSSDKVH